MQADIDWNELYTTLQPKLLHYFRVRLSSIQQAEDFVAMTFSRAWRRRHQYQPERGTLESWIFGIARYSLIDYLRRHEPISVSLDDITIEADESIEQTIEQQENIEKLYELLGVLSSRESRILSLKYGYQMRTHEIAEKMDLSEANVAKIMSRTLTKLRRFWDLGLSAPS